MMLKIQALLAATAVIAWTTLCASDPIAAIDPIDATTESLATIEDRFAIHQDDPATARQLADRYLALDKPGLAVAVLRTAPREVLEDPQLTHRLARAYEASGRVLDAYATADLALARCRRAIGTSDAPAGTPTPTFTCSEQTHAALDIHRTALGRMIAWGVSDPRVDDRVPLAYTLARRTARLDVASSE